MNGNVVRLVAILMLAACGSDDPSGPATGTTTVRMTATTFSPADVSVARGATVRWVNDAAIAHTITPTAPTQAGVWSNVQVPATQSFTFSHRFDAAGTFDYFCALHAGMTGRIRVQ